MNPLKSKGASCKCQICQKSQQIANLRSKHKRELSLATIYRKDYQLNPEDKNHIKMPKSTKNQSSNIKGHQKGYLQINSTYLLNYVSLSPHQNRAEDKQFYSPTKNVLQSYVSTYEKNHIKLPILKQESYKIKDFQPNDMKLPFTKVTEYSKNYLPNQKKRSARHKHRDHSFKGPINQYETTQKKSFDEKKISYNEPVIPRNNINPLKSSPFLYSITKLIKLQRIINNSYVVQMQIILKAIISTFSASILSDFYISFAKQ